MNKRQAILLWNELVTVSAAKYARFIGMNVFELGDNAIPDDVELANRKETAAVLRAMADAIDSAELQHDQ